MTEPKYKLTKAEAMVAMIDEFAREDREASLAKQRRMFARALAHRDRKDRPKRSQAEIWHELGVPTHDYEVESSLRLSRQFVQGGDDDARVPAILACWYRNNPGMADANLHRVAASRNHRRPRALQALLEQAAAVQPTVDSSDAELLRICELAKDQVICELVASGIDSNKVIALLDAWNIELRGLDMDEAEEAELDMTDEERLARHQALVRAAPAVPPTNDLPALIFQLDALLCARSTRETPNEEIVKQLEDHGIDVAAERKRFAAFEESLQLVKQPKAQALAAMLEDFDLRNLREDILGKPDEPLMLELEKRGVSRGQVEAIAARQRAKAAPAEADHELSHTEEEMQRVLAMTDEEVEASLREAGFDLATVEAQAMAWYELDSKLGENSIQHIAAERRKERWRAVQALLDRVDALSDDETKWE